jgi:hypothetical protein
MSKVIKFEKRVSFEEKLILENLFEEFVKSEIDSLKRSGEEVYGLDKWSEFRLFVSGGRYGSDMGSVGMNYIEGFLYELDMFMELMCDLGGCYRGEFLYENRDYLFDLLDKKVEDKNFVEEIKIKFDEYFEFEEDED